jgi:cytochrome c553
MDFTASRTAFTVLLLAAMLPTKSWASPSEEQLAICAACHNKDGNSKVADVPKLAGLDMEYIKRQLNDFKSGKRASPIMGAMVAPLNSHMVEELSEYFSGHTSEPPLGADDPVLFKNGKLIYDEGVVGSATPACSGCHGSDGAGDAKYPRLAGQHSEYIVKQLQSFREGTRANDLKGAMGAVAKRLNEDEIKAVAHYVNKLGREQK